jgi:hypothetical protein
MMSKRIPGFWRISSVAVAAPDSAPPRTMTSYSSAKGVGSMEG